jgi:hypothetical protein
MNKHADKAQIESEDVAAVRVLRTGDSDNKARNTKIDDLNALASDKTGKQVFTLFGDI